MILFGEHGGGLTWPAALIACMISSTAALKPSERREADFFEVFEAFDDRAGDLVFKIVDDLVFDEGFDLRGQLFEVGNGEVEVQGSGEIEPEEVAIDLVVMERVSGFGG